METTGNWYWIMDEIEAAECIPKLVPARKAKLMMGMLNKTDTLDARGLNQLQRTGTLPTMWIPPGELRDQRDLPRTRMVLVRQRTQLKNRIHATLAKYALTVAEVSEPHYHVNNSRGAAAVCLVSTPFFDMHHGVGAPPTEGRDQQGGSNGEEEALSARPRGPRHGQEARGR